MSTNLMQASTQWATRPADERFESIADLRNAVHGRRMRSRSVDIELDKISAREENGTIVLNRGFQSVEPTHWSFGQLAGAIKAPASYLRALPTPLALQCINHGLQEKARDTGAMKFMAITEDNRDLNTLQAVTPLRCYFPCDTLRLMSETAVFPPRRPLSNKGHPRVAKEVSQTIELQRDAFKLAKTAEEPLVRLRAMAEFRSLGDWRRVLRNKPLPGSLRPDGQPAVKNYRDRPRKRDYIAAAAAQVAEDAKAQPSVNEVQR